MTMSDLHTTKAFDSDLKELTRMVSEMGGLAEKQIADAVDALAQRDTELAQRVAALDATIDRLQHDIEEKAILTIARRQPMAIDLREIVAALRLVNDIERIGDLAKNIAKRVIALNADFPPPNLIRGVEHMSELVLGQLQAALDSFVRRDLVKAMEVWRNDKEIDAVCTSVYRELLTYMMEDPRNISFCIHLMFCAKNIERMGDHATNIAETVHYMIEGRPITDQRPKIDMTAAFAAMPDGTGS
jgi:phosphate transport system protein